MSNKFSFPYIEKFVLKSLDSCLVESACIAAGLSTFRLAPLMMVARHPGSGDSFPFFRTASRYTSVPGRQICGFKQWTRRVLAHQGVSVPEGRVFTRERLADALDFAEKLGWPVVLKPAAGTGGVMVTTNITARERLQELILQFKEGEAFIVERHCAGLDYRILVIGNSVVSVLRREAANVKGDGASTVLGLIKNKNFRRRRNPRLRNSLIKSAGSTVQNTLAAQGLELSSVPAEGQVVALSTAANVSSGGECWDVTDETHPSIIAFIEQAMAALPGVNYAGFDVLIRDHALGLDHQDAWICEVNSSAEIAMHEFAPKGNVRAVSRTLVADVLGHTGLSVEFKEERRARVVIDFGRIVTPEMATDLQEWMDGLSLVGEKRIESERAVLDVSGECRNLAILSGLAFSPSGWMQAESCEIAMVDT